LSLEVGWDWVGSWELELSSRLGVAGCFLNVDKDFFAYFLFIIEFINIDL